MTWLTASLCLGQAANTQRIVNEISTFYWNHFQNGLVWRLRLFKPVFIPTLQHQLSGKIFLWFFQMTWRRLCMPKGRKFFVTLCLATIPWRTSSISGIIANKPVIGSKVATVTTTLHFQSSSPWVFMEMTLQLTRDLKLGLSLCLGGAAILHMGTVHWPDTFPSQCFLSMWPQSLHTKILWNPSLPGSKTWLTHKCFLTGQLMAMHSWYPRFRGTWNLLLSNTGFTITVRIHVAPCVVLWKRMPTHLWQYLIFARMQLILQLLQTWRNFTKRVSGL